LAAAVLLVLVVLQAKAVMAAIPYLAPLLAQAAVVAQADKEQVGVLLRLEMAALVVADEEAGPLLERGIPRL